MLRPLAFLALLFSLFTSNAWAWSDAGHKIIASIAFRSLTASEQNEIVALLRQHPRFQADFLDKMPADLDEVAKPEWLFQQAAIWADMIRGFPEELKAQYHHGPWHYINWPHFLTDADRTALDGKVQLKPTLEAPAKLDPEMNVVQTIRYARARLTESHATKQEQALLLAWLFHCVGDIHQPLHSTTLFCQKLFPEGDRGGNLIPTRQHGNLHALWDGFPGGKAEYRVARDDTLRLLGETKLAALGKSSARQLDEAVWLDESHALAVTAVYDPEVVGHLRIARTAPDDHKLEALSLSDDYLRASCRVCDRRVVQAGFRLGAVLKTLIK